MAQLGKCGNRPATIVLALAPGGSLGRGQLVSNHSIYRVLDKNDSPTATVY